MSNFHVGQKVVCVDDSLPAAAPDETARVKLNAVYTIRGFDHEDTRYAPGVLLAGITCRTPPGWNYEAGWRPQRFRPVIERKTDISDFEAMLSPNRRTLEPALTEQVSPQASLSHEST